MGRKHTKATKLKLLANLRAYPVRVINNKTDEIKNFTSIRQVAKFIGVQNSYITSYLKKDKFCIIKGYHITRNLSVNKEN
jgi:hypothetical protein